jgi:hypothetical protein
MRYERIVAKYGQWYHVQEEEKEKDMEQKVYKVDDKEVVVSDGTMVRICTEQLDKNSMLRRFINNSLSALDLPFRMVTVNTVWHIEINRTSELHKNQSGHCRWREVRFPFENEVVLYK